jgi:putative heme transporter
VAVEAAIGGPYVWGLLQTVSGVKPWWILAAVLAEIVSMAALARLQRRILRAAGTRLPLALMVRTTYAAYFLNVTVPGGLVVSNVWTVNRLRRMGATTTGATFAAAITLAMTLATFAGMAALAAVLTDPASWASYLPIAVLAACVPTVVLLARRSALSSVVENGTVRLLHLWNRIRHRPPNHGYEAAVTFIADLGAFHPRPRDWIFAAAAAWITWLADFLCLVTGARAVGADELSIAVLIGAWLAGAGATNLTILPGGLGVVDAAMILTLSASAHAPEAATATTVLYRLISFAIVAVVGLAAWVGATWRTVADDRTP